MTDRIQLRFRSKKKSFMNRRLYPAILILLLYFKMLYLIQLPGTFGDRTNVIIPMLMCDFILMLVILKGNSNFFDIPHARYFVGLIFFLVIEITHSFIVYPEESCIKVILAATPYTLLFSYFIFYNAAENCFEELIKIILLFSTIVAVLFIVQAFAFNSSGRLLIDIYRFSYGNIRIMYRSGVRLLACDLVTYSAVISVGCLFCKGLRDKKVYWINIITVIIYEFYVSQTRGTQLVVFATFLFVFVFSGKKRNAFRILKVILFIALILVGAQEIIGYISAVVLSVTRKTDYSMYQRVAEIQYYLSILKTKWPLGIGLLGTHSTYESLISGGRQYTYSDVGIVGVFAHFGVVGLIIYIIPMLDLIKKSMGKDGEINSLAMAATVATVISCMSLSLWDTERMIVYPVLWAIVQVNSEGKEKKYAENSIYFIGRSM